jgi:predicted metal-dependent enzyme (double-stranded beta helix superfamily)
MKTDGDLQTFIDDVELIVGSTDDQYEITKRVSERLLTLLTSDYRLPPELTRPSAEHHVNYPLHIAPGDSWSLAAVVWNVGQRTPVHGHDTWGVVGIYSGAEREFRYIKPTAAESGPLTPAGEQVWKRGDVTVCCTTDDDVHAVAAVGDEPTVGIHVYGANIGTIERSLYDPATGAVRRFVSGWNTPQPADQNLPAENLSRSTPND